MTEAADPCPQLCPTGVLSLASLADLVETQIVGPHLGASDSVGLR